ncbi:hypothetical protein [Pontibacter cellulosilyticus]|uniref:Uncharacterized protein n=1 Tax=Pontibacter cellulosilyticus TaxID=1720253 RepID=A0A923SIJ2_9BACT|nr:hypothetical protein [Pontibacter cellulosilyticus]MBC5992662.1 hypothetical protein [Pontibacter cellulosilyticus]
MNITLLKQLNGKLKAFAIVLLLGATTLACQENKELKEETNTVEASATEATAVVDKRPAPEFFVVPAEMAQKRVWICENNTADIFHVKHDCPVLIECKGKGTFRNMTLARAIEDYDRYNCQTCAKDLDFIYDEDAVRMETGLGQQ